MSKNWARPRRDQDQEAAEEMWEFSANDDDDASKLHTHDDKSTRKK